MNQSNYEVVVALLEELQQEYDCLQEEINEYLFKIKEKDCYIRSFLKKDDQDFKIFSPRNLEDLHREEISKVNEEKTEIQQKLNNSYHKQNLLRSKIEKLQRVANDEKEFHIDSHVREQNLTILNIQEEDRQRIARDLHDTSLQNLTHLVHKIELSSMFIDQDPLRAKLELAVISKNLKSVIEEIRNTIFDLRPMSFDDLGLEPAFEELIQKVNCNNDYEIETDIENVSCENDLILATIFRVVQECLINVTKHAEATKILLRCKKQNNVCLIDIIDNGKGFTIEEMESKRDRHFGISVMNERIALLGGKITIDSQKDSGTNIHIEVPLS